MANVAQKRARYADVLAQPFDALELELGILWADVVL
jgi:hypothetical protein